MFRMIITRRNLTRLRREGGREGGDVQVTREWAGRDPLHCKPLAPSTRGSSEPQAGRWQGSLGPRTVTALLPRHTSPQQRSQATGQGQATMRLNRHMVIPSQHIGRQEGRRRKRGLHTTSPNQPMKNQKRQTSMGLPRLLHLQVTKSQKRRMNMVHLKLQLLQAIKKRKQRRNMDPRRLQ